MLQDILAIVDIYLREFWLVTCKMAPWVLLGFLIAGVLSVFFSPEFIKKHLGNSRFGSIVKAALIGIPMPLCISGVIPMTLSLRRHGASKGTTSSFLISTPQTGVDSFIPTWFMLGWVFALFKVLTAFAAGVIAGVAVDHVSAAESPSKENIKTPEPKAPEKAILQILKYGFGTLFHDVAKPLLIGLLIAAAIATFIPADQFKFNNWISFLLMLVIGLPIYVCSTASVPIAVAMILKGISPGAALVFLIVGPATNMATITTMFKTVGRRGVAIYIGTIIIVALGAGFLLNLSIEQVPAVMNVMSTVKCDPESIRFYHQISAVLLLLLTLRVVVSGEGKTEEAPEDFVIESVIPEEDDIHANKLVINVPSMTGENSAETIREALMNLQDVEQVECEVQSRSVTITFNYEKPDLAAVRAVLSAAGFKMSEA